MMRNYFTYSVSVHLLLFAALWLAIKAQPAANPYYYKIDFVGRSGPAGPMKIAKPKNQAKKQNLAMKTAPKKNEMIIPAKNAAVSKAKPAEEIQPETPDAMASSNGVEGAEGGGGGGGGGDDKGGYSFEGYLPFYKVQAPPAPLSAINPRYPEKARKLGVEGLVVLELWIDEKGVLRKMDVVKSAGWGFDEAALESVRNTAFDPAIVDNKQVASRIRLPIRFKLE